MGKCAKINTCSNLGKSQSNTFKQKEGEKETQSPAQMVCLNLKTSLIFLKFIC